MFIVQTSLKSLLRKPLLTSLLLLNITVMTSAMLLLLSVMNGEWRTYVRNEGTRIVALQTHPGLTEMLVRLKEWGKQEPASLVSLQSIVKLPLSYGDVQGDYSVSGTGKEGPIWGETASRALLPGEALLTSPLADKLGGGNPDSLLGQDITIDGQAFSVMGILENQPLDTVFVNYESLAAIADPIVTTLFVQTSSPAFSDTILADLAPYGPSVRELNNAREQSAIKQKLTEYTGLAAILGVFSLVSYLQLFQYKLSADSYRWSIFGLFGARRSHLLGAALLESSAIVSAAFGTGLLLFASIRNYVDIPYVVMAYDVQVLLAVGALLILLLACLAALLPFYIRGRRDALARLST